MRLKPARGGNQRGICFISGQDAAADAGVFTLTCNAQTWLADVRTNSQVKPGHIFLDSRIYDVLQIADADEVSLDLHAKLHVKDVPALSELIAKVQSTKGLDSARIADAISKRVSDLKDDLDGLILRNGDVLPIERLGIQFTISDLQPESPARVQWDRLLTIRLESPAPARPCNILLALEIGAASHIPDAGGSRRRVDVFIEVLEEFANQFDQYGKGGFFSGFAFSEEVLQFAAFDSNTGEKREMVPLDSKSIIDAFLDWARELLLDHSRAPSDLGDVISDSIEVAQKMTASSGLPTVIILLSSGVFSVGPNPVKSARRGLDQDAIGFQIVTAGDGIEMDILSAIGDLYEHQPIKIDNTRDIDVFLESLRMWTTKVAGL